MNLNKLKDKHGDKSLRKEDFSKAINLIDHIQTQLDGVLENDKRKYRNAMLENQLDNKSPHSAKQARQDKAEFSVLVAHEIIGSIQNALDEVAKHWTDLKSIHLNKEGY
ncbi:TPA: hypothetical protein ACJFV9_004397 [Salmonella enterica subsp. enterica serovar Infantis]